MLIKKICSICGKEFVIPHWRVNTAKYCSVKCQNDGIKAPKETICTNCGKAFHIKPYQKKRYSRHAGYFCSKACFNEYKKEWFKGENNHQYGLKGDKNSSFKGKELPYKNHNNTDIYVYAPTHPFANKRGRVTKHRLVVEENRLRFNPDFFQNINDVWVLKKSYQVHHIDGNHDNNNIENLIVVTRGEHTTIHNQHRKQKRDIITGKFIKNNTL